MLDGLDDIPWKDLRHAYGPAGDVPALIRALPAMPPDAAYDDGAPLHELYTNIWHQGTIYGATPYAVPFLIEVAADRATLDRVGVLQLLADIAKSSDGPGDPSHDAVAAGFDVLAALTDEAGDVALAAAHVLAQLRGRADDVGPFVRRLLAAEKRPVVRAGYLLLLGDCGDRSPASVETLLSAAAGRSKPQRRATAWSLARLRPDPLPPAAAEAIEALVEADDVEEAFDGIPWDATADYDPDEVAASLDATDRTDVIDRLTTALEAGTADTGQVDTLIHLLFPLGPAGSTPPLSPDQLSPAQTRAVRAMAPRIVRGERIFYGSFVQFGLPNTARGWRDLAASLNPPG